MKRKIPIDLAFSSDNKEVEITWSDRSKSVLEAGLLRQKCPCAQCRTEREKVKKTSLKSLRVLDANSTPEPAEIQFSSYEPMGTYAISFAFSDGHGTGIYTYDFLDEVKG